MVTLLVAVERGDLLWCCTMWVPGKDKVAVFIS